MKEVQIEFWKQDFAADLPKTRRATGTNRSHSTWDQGWSDDAKASSSVVGSRVWHDNDSWS